MPASIRKPLYRHLPNLGRALLLAVAALAVAVAAVWVQWPSLVNELDARLVADYESGPERRLADARRLLREDQASGIDQLTALLEDLAEVRKTDRLAPLKVRALDLLTARLLASGDVERGIAWTRAWVQLDDRHLIARARLARLLQRSGAVDEAIDGLAAVQARFPEVDVVTEPLVDMLIGQGRQAEACQVLLDYLRWGDRGFPDAPSTIQQDWQVFWDIGDGFRPERTELLVGVLGAGGRLRLQAELPPGSRAVRFDMPAHVRFRLADLRLSLSSGGDRRDVDLAGMRRNQVAGDADLLVVSGDGNDPFFTVPLPESSLPDVSGGEVPITVRGAIVPDSGTPADGRPWHVYTDLGQGFAASKVKPVPVSVTADGVIELAFTVPLAVQRLRLDPPGNSRLRLRRPRIALAGAQPELEILELAPRLNQMVREGDELVASGGEDPYVTILAADLYRGMFSTVVLEANLQHLPPTWSRRVLGLPEVDRLTAELRAAGDLATLARLEELRKRALHGDQIAAVVETAEAGMQTVDRITVGAECREQGFSFELSADAEGGASRVGFRFPGLVGSAIAVQALEVWIEGEDAPRDVSGGGSAPVRVQYRDLAVDAGNYRVTGGSPAVDVLPGDGSRVRSARLRGVVR